MGHEKLQFHNFARMPRWIDFFLFDHRNRNAAFEVQPAGAGEATRPASPLRTHNNIRPFACNFRGADGEFACGQTFSTSSHATRHERTHTKDAPRRVAPAKKGRGLPWQDVVRALLQD